MFVVARLAGPIVVISALVFLAYIYTIRLNHKRLEGKKEK